MNIMSTVDPEQLAALAATFATYMGVGLHAISKLQGNARTPEQLDFIVEMNATMHGRAFKGLMILTWPLWYVLPAILKHVPTLFRRGSSRAARMVR